MTTYIQHTTTGETFAARIEDGQIVAQSAPLHHSEVAGDPADCDMETLDEPLPMGSDWRTIQPQPTIRKIRVGYLTGNLDMEGLDNAALCEAYETELHSRLGAKFPDAEIEISSQCASGGSLPASLKTLVIDSNGEIVETYSILDTIQRIEQEACEAAVRTVDAQSAQ